MHIIKADPLTNILKGKIKKENVKSNKDCERAFTALKDKSIMRPILCVSDFSKELTVQTDATVYMAVFFCHRRGIKTHTILFSNKKFFHAK